MPLSCGTRREHKVGDAITEFRERAANTTVRNEVEGGTSDTTRNCGVSVTHTSDKTGSGSEQHQGVTESQSTTTAHFAVVQLLTIR